jgi:hypothetical protein
MLKMLKIDCKIAVLFTLYLLEVYLFSVVGYVFCIGIMGKIRILDTRAR